jgi:hypothetical protein
VDAARKLLLQYVGEWIRALIDELMNKLGALLFRSMNVYTFQTDGTDYNIMKVFGTCMCRLM